MMHYISPPPLNREKSMIELVGCFFGHSKQHWLLSGTDWTQVKNGLYKGREAAALEYIENLGL